MVSILGFLVPLKGLLGLFDLIPNGKKIICPYNPHAINLKVMASLLTDLLSQALRKKPPSQRASCVSAGSIRDSNSYRKHFKHVNTVVLGE